MKVEHLEELKKSVVERFKLNSYIIKLSSDIRIYAKNETFNKYKGSVIIRDGLEYELFCVCVDFNQWNEFIEILPINLILAYGIKSKINSYQKKVLAKEVDRITHGGFPLDSKYIIGESYKIEVEEVLSGNINLKIE